MFTQCARFSRRKVPFNHLQIQIKCAIMKTTNPELPPDYLEGKFSRLNLNLKVNNRLVNVEIQVKNEPDYRDRTLFYWAKLYFRTKERRELQRTKADDYNKYYQFQYV